MKFRIGQHTAICILVLLTANPLLAIRWSDVPEIVRQAVEEEVPGIDIEEVELERHNGVDFYEIEGEVNGAEVELKVGEDGTILDVEFESAGQNGDDDDEDHGWDRNGWDRNGWDDPTRNQNDRWWHDHDHDGMRDEDEEGYGCNPEDADSDDDSYPDGFEQDHGSDPTDPNSKPQIMTIKSECTAGGGVCLFITVRTFEAGTFQLEFLGESGEWTPLGGSFTGDGEDYVHEIPVTAGAGGGMFRTTIEPAPEVGDDEHHDSDDSGSHSCAPDSVEGMTFEIDVDDGDSKTYKMNSGSSGQVVEDDGQGGVEFYPYDYEYEKTGDCTAKITITFPSDGDDESGVEITLTFTPEGTGTVTVRQFSGDNFSGGEEGSFSKSG
jgi:hypothetical protein